MSENYFFGKKCFFISSENEQIKDLVYNIFKNGFETYFIEDVEKLGIINKDLNDSILFFFIDKNSNIKNIEDIYSGINVKGIKINFIIPKDFSNNKIVTKIITADKIFQYKKNNYDLENQLIEYLNNNDAKGRRQYIRVNCANCIDKNDGKFKILLNSNEYFGEIMDISIAGMRGNFKDSNLILDKDQKLEKIILKLYGNEIIISGSVLRYESVNNQNIYVLLFDLPSIKNDDKDVMYSFIYSCLQEYIKKIK